MSCTRTPDNRYTVWVVAYEKESVIQEPFVFLLYQDAKDRYKECIKDPNVNWAKLKKVEWRSKPETIYLNISKKNSNEIMIANEKYHSHEILPL